MGTDIWFNVTVEGAPEGWLENLPDFKLINGDKWDEWPTSYDCSGEGRYGDEVNITAWARSFTLMVLGTTVTVNTEWHADGYVEEGTVYRDGQVVNEESTTNATVPVLLHDWLEEGKRVLAHYDEVSAGGYGAGDHQLLAHALRQLTEGLSHG